MIYHGQQILSKGEDLNNEIIFAPASVEQENFLTCKNVDFAFYGGE